MNLKKYIERDETIRRLHFSGPMKKGKELMAAMHAEGWKFLYSGPGQKRNGDLDTTRFLFIAEKTPAKESTKPAAKHPTLVALEKLRSGWAEESK